MQGNLLSKLVTLIQKSWILLLPKFVFAFTSSSTGVSMIDTTKQLWELVMKVLVRVGIITGFVLAAIAIKYSPGQGIVKIIVQLLIGGITAWVGVNYAPSAFGFVLT